MFHVQFDHFYIVDFHSALTVCLKKQGPSENLHCKLQVTLSPSTPKFCRNKKPVGSPQTNPQADAWKVITILFLKKKNVFWNTLVGALENCLERKPVLLARILPTRGHPGLAPPWLYKAGKKGLGGTAEARGSCGSCFGSTVIHTIYNISAFSQHFQQ